MEREKPIMTEKEIRKYFDQKGLAVEIVGFDLFTHIEFSPTTVASFFHLQEVVQDMGDPDPCIAGSFGGGFELIIDITKNPFKK